MGYLLFLFLALFSGCASGFKSQSDQTVPHSSPLLKFQKTPCYGTCPSYEATIMEDGSITYIGWEHTPVLDTVSLQLPKQELQNIKNEIAALPYKSMQDAYLSEWTDVPSTYLTFYEKGIETKRIKHQEGGPKPLLNFQEHLDSVINSLIESRSSKH